MLPPFWRPHLRGHYPGCLCGPEFCEVLFGTLDCVAPLGGLLFRSISAGGGDSYGGCSALGECIGAEWLPGWIENL